MLTRLILAVTAFLGFATPGFSAEPDLSTPQATFRTFLEAMQKNDLELAKRCWTVDDENRSGAIDVLVGRWIAARKLAAVTNAKLGANGTKLLGRWNRSDLSDPAIARTLIRLDSSEVKELDEIAKLKFKWQPGDGTLTAIFMYINAPHGLRKIGKEWKIDANIFTETDQAADLFKPGSIWLVWREEMDLMNQLTEMLEKRKIQSVAQFEKQLKESVEVLKIKYAAESGKP